MKAKQVKLLVTHQNPDPDAVAACWLFLKFDETVFSQAQLYFVPSGSEIDRQTLAAKEVKPAEVVHVDTGLGEFDHHQKNNRLRDSATLKVFEFLKLKFPDLAKDEALKRMVMIINDNDHFAACWWPEANNDRYGFMLEEILKGLRNARGFSDRELVEFGMICLDAIYVSMKQKVKAETEIKDSAQEFTSPWGKALAIENNNDEVIKVAQKMGYKLVVRKEEDKGHMRIKAVPDRGIDLTPLADVIMAKDKTGTWFFHPAKTMLINGSRHNPNHVPTPLSLDEVVEIIKSLKIK